MPLLERFGRLLLACLRQLHTRTSALGPLVSRLCPCLLRLEFHEVLAPLCIGVLVPTVDHDLQLATGFIGAGLLLHLDLFQDVFEGNP